VGSSASRRFCARTNRDSTAPAWAGVQAYN